MIMKILNLQNLQEYRQFLLRKYLRCQQERRQRRPLLPALFRQEELYEFDGKPKS
jgi:hypothetical protein